jgi:cytidylate kinase
MAVITISRQMGCLGCEIADALAQCLGYRVVWREVINEAASRAGAPEVALATIDELDLLGIRPTSAQRKAYHDAVREIMLELAQAGNVVIVGRAGQVILRGTGAIHVRLYAPIDLRIGRVMQRHQVTEAVARKQVETSDRARTRYLKAYYHVRWDDPDLYDMMLNTGQFEPTTAALVICKALEQREKAQ